ncbi:hypothetical protein JRO89_XS04G0127300 [Xanthoceras sorbifolium]|uniref:Uncharacterized protein n=1 Tax=Xanthoceras sorbifolium TaxID=99658 RepID=A0ABQ8I530_9ROSI|nr:hypothetical protein JRO89_XS04G0127300 [Xanthoceras sorbifolium]
MKKMSMIDLKLKDDGGSFDLLPKATKKASNGNEDLKLQLLTTRVIEDLVNSQYEKVMERTLLVVRDEEAAFHKEIDGRKFDNLGFNIPKKTRSNKTDFFFSQHTEEEEDDYEEDEVIRVFEDLVNSLYQKTTERALLVFTEEEETFQKDIDGPKFNNLCFNNPKKPRSNKGLCFSQHTEEDNDYENEEIVRKPPLKKQRKTYNLEKKKKNYDDEVGTNHLVELRSHIERIKGSDVVLVMQKKLTTTDMDTHQNRLSVPRGKIGRNS